MEHWDILIQNYPGTSFFDIFCFQDFPDTLCFGISYYSLGFYGTNTFFIQVALHDFPDDLNSDM